MIKLGLELEPEEPRVGRPLRGVLRVATNAPVEGCTLVLFARLRGARADVPVERFGGYDEPTVQAGPFDWGPGKHRVAFELPAIRGPASRRGRALVLAWSVVAELRDASGDSFASSAFPVEIAPRSREPLPEEIVVGGYRDVPRAIATAFEPELGDRHVEGARPPKLTLGERVEGALFASRDLDARLEAAPSRLSPGDTFGVTLYLYARSSLTVSSARVALVHHERAGELSSAITVAEEPFTVAAVELEPGHRRFKVRLGLPDDAGSYADERLVSEWVARAVVQPAGDAPLILETVLTVA